MDKQEALSPEQIVERLDVAIEQSKSRNGDALYLGEPDQLLVDLRAGLTTLQARIAKLEGEKKATWKAVMMSVANESRACQDRVSKVFRQALNGGDDV